MIILCVVFLYIYFCGLKMAHSGRNYGTIIWTDVSYGCAKWSLAIRQERHIELSDRFHNARSLNHLDRVPDTLGSWTEILWMFNS